MRGRGGWLVATLVGASVGAGCATPRAEVALAAPLAAEPARPLGVFAPGDAILSGLDVADEPGRWRPGDQVLIGIEIAKPSERVVRFLRVELTDRLAQRPLASFRLRTRDGQRFDFSSPVAATSLTLYDESGGEIGTIPGRFPISLLDHGPYDGSEWEVRHPGVLDATVPGSPRMSQREFETAMRGWMSLFAFSGSLSRPGVFHSLLDDLIARPSIFRLIFRRDVALVAAEPRPAAHEPWPVGDGRSLETIRRGLRLEIAGRPAMEAVITAVPCRAPLGLCGGLVAVDARRADEPGTTVRVRLLAARRGPVDAVWKRAGSPDPDD